MILRQYQSLGLLPELIVFAFLLASVLTLAYSTFKINYRDPVIVVANATGAGPLQPAQADEAYIRSFAANFLANWATWNQYTYQYRKSVAIMMMTPSVRSIFTDQAQRGSGLMTSLSQSQSLSVQDLTITALALDNAFVRVDFSADLRIYYGGIGGEVEPYHGSLLLRAIKPSPGSPLCLEVFGFLIDRKQDSNS
jgi:hypothetical protein